MTEGDYKKVPLDEKPEKHAAELHYGYGVRHVQAFLMFFSLTIGYMARAHLGVTIVAMTDTHEAVNRTNPIVQGYNNVTANDTTYDNMYILSRNSTEDCGSQCKQNFTDITENKRVAHNTYSWPKSIQEMVLGAFFVGYGTMMFPIGLVCQKWGGKVPLQIALAVNGVVSILTPWLTAWGNWKVLCACRVLQGLSQSGFYPGIHTLLAQWVPLSERGSLSSIVYTGTLLGTVAAFQVGGILGASAWGWPSTFWVTGLMCLIAFAMLSIFGASSPSNHKRISENEKNFILGRIDDGVKRKPKMPWKAVLSSKHVWASFAAHMGSGVAFVFFFTQVPTYMHAILKVNIKSSGLLSSLPYVASFFSTMLNGYLSDFLTNRKIVSIRTARVMSNSIACVVPAMCVAAVSFTTNVTLAVAFFVVSMMAFGMIHTGWMVNYMDLAPNFSGGLMAIGNTITNIFVMLLPILVSRIVIDVADAYQWRIMMFFMAGLLLVTNTIFVIFMSSKTQAWNEENEEKEDDMKS
ncbi:unnamed protein product, partial [Iphiclides podalirius]